MGFRGGEGVIFTPAECTDGREQTSVRKAQTVTGLSEGPWGTRYHGIPVIREGDRVVLLRCWYLQRHRGDKAL